MLIKPDDETQRQLRGTPSPEHSDEEDWSETSSTSESPVYTPQELADTFLDFYTFLTTLHYDNSDLKVPPPGGWPNLTPEFCAGFKSDYALEVMRHLPYLNSRAAIEYKSGLVDCTTFSKEDFEQGEWREEYVDFQYSEGEVDSSHVFFIAFGRESGGVDLLLDTLHGEILVEYVRCGPGGSHDVNVFFSNLKEEYRSLRLIPCVGRITMSADKVEEREDVITEEEFRAQTEHWGTDLDVQFVRQIYRQHGWPDAFQREEAMKAIDELMETMGERDWPSGEHATSGLE